MSNRFNISIHSKNKMLHFSRTVFIFFFEIIKINTMSLNYSHFFTFKVFFFKCNLVSNNIFMYIFQDNKTYFNYKNIDCLIQFIYQLAHFKWNLNTSKLVNELLLTNTYTCILIRASGTSKLRATKMFRVWGFITILFIFCDIKYSQPSPYLEHCSYYN